MTLSWLPLASFQPPLENNPLLICLSGCVVCTRHVYVPLLAVYMWQTGLLTYVYSKM